MATKIFNRAILVAGEARRVGASKTLVTVLEYDNSGMIVRCKGATLPANGNAGYATGCIFIDTDSGVNSTFYVNDGSSTSCNFNASNGAYIVALAGKSASENDADASVVITATGVLSSDMVFATIIAQAGTATIIKAVPTADTITVTLSGNGGAGTVIAYQVLRAAA